MTISLPRMSINGFKEFLTPQVFRQDDEFEQRTIDGAVMRMTIYIKLDTGAKYFYFHTAFQVYGWTDDDRAAWQAWGNLSVFTCNEIYNAFRGKKQRTVAAMQGK